MKREKKVEFGITITKPWSKEMYAHNELVADVVRNEVEARWIAALMEFQKEFDGNDEMLECEFTNASDELKAIQKAVTCYGFGSGYDVAKVSSIVEQELEDAPLYRLNQIAEELKLDLKVGFVGF
jgi:hypothetical protein